ncbi:hypothetical protein NM688_g3999 [Phlebia brevispora]|uniref:Uncharacterized protein n=1 Tax=Phlebia brevispora TaxID=194682 RepID=A0ACC1T455_9APHY|nr:hypothetical protein NM688_g3999 [Phlebia brevispora]
MFGHVASHENGQALASRDEDVTSVKLQGGGLSTKSHIAYETYTSCQLRGGTLNGLWDGDHIMLSTVIPATVPLPALAAEQVVLEMPLRTLTQHCRKSDLELLVDAHNLALARRTTVNVLVEQLQAHTCTASCIEHWALCRRPLVSQVNPFGLHDYTYARHRLRVDTNDDQLLQIAACEDVPTSCTPACKSVDETPAPYHFPPTPHSPRALSTFVRRWTEVLHAEDWIERPCAVCAQLKQQTLLAPVSIDDPCMELLYEHATRVTFSDDGCSLPAARRILCQPAIDWHAREAQVCNTCRYSLTKRKLIPTISLANGLWLGDPPPEVLSLSFVEKLIVARYRHNVCVVKVDMGQRKMRANAVIFAQPIGEFRTILPPPPSELDEFVCVLFTGACKPEPDDFKRTPLLVNRRRLLCALQWFVRFHKDYHNITISYDNIAAYPENTIPVSWMHRVTKEDSTPLSMPLYETTNLEGTEEGPCPLAVHGMTVENVEKMTRDQRIAAAVNHLRQGGSFVTYGHDSQMQSMYHNSELYPGLFPWLFPYGLGGFDNSLVSIGIPHKRHIQYLLNYYDRRFQRDEYFPFIAFNHSQIKASSRGAYVLTEKRHFDTVVEKVLNIDQDALNAVIERGKDNSHIQPQTAAEKSVFELINIIDNVAGHVPASNTQKKYQRTQVKSLIYDRGAPAVFVTFAPNDVGNIICLRFCGYDIPLDALVEDLPTKQVRLRAIANNPVACAKFFHLMVKLFIECILCADSDEEGLFGRTEAYYGTVEEQGRETLHLHMLVWIKNCLSPQEIRDKIVARDSVFQQELFAWLEGYHQGEFSRGTMESVGAHVRELRSAPNGYNDPCLLLPPMVPDLTTEEELNEWFETLCTVTDEILYSRNKHSYDHSYKCKRPPDYVCRGRFPRDYVPFTWADYESGAIRLKKGERWLNTFNIVLTYLLRCNTDVTSLLSGTQVKAVMAYVTDYITKMSLKTHTLFETVRSVLDRNLDIIAESGSRAEAARRLLAKIVNGLTAQIQTGGPMACTELLSLPLYYTSEKFKVVYWYSYLRAIENAWQTYHEDTEQDPEDDDAVKIGRVNDRLASVSKVDDYVYRPDECECMSLSDYLKRTVIKKLTPALRERISNGTAVTTEAVRPDDDEIDHDVTGVAKLRVNTSRYYQLHVGHPLRESHGVFLLKPGPEYVLTYAGGNIPRAEQDDREQYYRFLLMMFHPTGWRTGKELKSETETWAEAYAATHFSERNIQRTRHMNVLYECQDARDNFAAQRRAAKSGEEVPFDILPNIDTDELDNEHDELTVLEQTMTDDAHKVAEAIYEEMGSVTEHHLGLMNEMKEAMAIIDIRGRHKFGVIHADDVQSIEPPIRSAAEWKDALDTTKQARLDSRRRVNDTLNAGSTMSFEERLFAGTARIVTASDLSPIQARDALQQAKISSTAEIDEIASAYGLNADQRRAFVVAAARTTHCAYTPLRMYIGGMAGSGKSRVIEALKAFYCDGGEGGRFELMAPTGAAASLIGGSTYHTLLALGRSATSDGRPSNIARAKCNLGCADVLVTDEVSMIGCTDMHRMSTQVCRVKDAPFEAFGGLHIIFVGDFAQLAPPGSGAYPLYSTTIDVAADGHTPAQQRNISGKALWHCFTDVVLLKQNMRQNKADLPNEAFRDALANMRYGACTEQNLKVLRTRIAGLDAGQPHMGEEQFRNISILTAWNAHRDAINEASVERFAADNGRTLYTFFSNDRVGKKELDDSARAERRAAIKNSKSTFGIGGLNAREREILWSLSPAKTNNLPSVLKLCIGLPVMLKHNEATELSATNGAEGIVVGWQAYPLTNEKQALRVVFVQLTNPPQPVQLNDLPLNVVPVVANTQSVDAVLPNDEPKTIRRQQPWMLPNFAMTDFSAQGRTRPFNPVDLRHCKGHQSVYTCLSRSSTLDGTLILYPWNERKVTRGLSSDLKREFRELEILNDITRRRLEGNLSDNVLGNTRGALVTTYFKAYGIHFIPPDAPRRYRLMLVPGQNTPADANKTSKRKEPATPRRGDERNQTKRSKTNMRDTPPPGCRWDNVNWSCAYDSVVDIFAALARWESELLLELRACGNNVLIQLTRDVTPRAVQRASLEQARDTLRSTMFNINPRAFPRYGQVYASAGDLLHRLLDLNEQYLEAVVTCTTCGFVTDRRADSNLLSHWIPSGMARTTSEVLQQILNTTVKALVYFPPLIAIQMPAATPESCFLQIDRELQVAMPHTSSTYRLCGIVYWGQDHYTACVSDHDHNYWYHDGMSGQNYELISNTHDLLHLRNKAPSILMYSRL